jgi:hypothetical protein
VSVFGALISGFTTVFCGCQGAKGGAWGILQRAGGTLEAGSRHLGESDSWVILCRAMVCCSWGCGRYAIVTGASSGK